MRLAMTLTLLTFAAACPPEAGTGPAAAAVARITTSTSSQLVSVGGSATLRATAYDAAGNVLPDAVITWRTDDDAVVAVDAAGTLDGRALGSTRVRATAGDVQSEPVLAWVATVSPGALLFEDDQLVEGPTFEEEGAPEVGRRYSVVLADVAVPDAGTIVMATQGAAVAGRVVSATPVGSGAAVELEIVSLPELFVDLELELRDTVTVAPTTGLATKFEAFGFQCESELGGNVIPEPDLATRLSENVVLTHDGALSVRDRRLEHAKVTVSGNVTLSASGSITFPLDFADTVTCKRQVGITPTYPIAWLAFTVALKTPLGVGFELAGSFEGTTVKARVSGSARADVVLGFEYTPATGFQEISSVETTDGLRVDWEPLVSGRTVKASVFPFAYAELNAGFTIGPDAQIAEVRAGVKGELEYTTPPEQVSAPTEAAKYLVRSHAELLPGEHYKKLLEFLGLEVETITFDPPDDAVLFKSPEGTTSVSSTEVVANQPIIVSVALDPATVNYIDGYNVDSVHVWRQDGDGPWAEVEEIDATTDQTAFEYRWTPTAVDAQGDANVSFAATVDTTAMPGLQLEVAADSRQTFLLDDSLPPPDFVGVYAMTSWNHTSTGAGKQGDMVVCPGTGWEIGADGQLTWRVMSFSCTGGTLADTFGGPASPSPVSFTPPSFSYASEGTIESTCPGNTIEHDITGSVTVNADGSARLDLVLVTTDTYVGSTDLFNPTCDYTETNVNTDVFVATKPAP